MDLNITQENKFYRSFNYFKQTFSNIDVINFDGRLKFETCRVKCYK